MTIGFGAAGAEALNQLNNLPFDNIIGGPLNAAINAQAQAAETTMDFIQTVGMREVNGQKEAINVQFVYEDGAGTIRRITVPILAIVPIPFIVIDNVAIAFKAKITASTAAQSSQAFSQSGYIRGYAGYRGRRFRANLSAGYSAKKDSKASQESKYSVEYTMDVQVNASQAGLPAGMEAVLGFLQQGTYELPESIQIKTLGFDSFQNLPKDAAFKQTFDLVLSDTASQPLALSDSQVTIDSINGFVVGVVEDVATGNTGDGLYKVSLEQGASWPTSVASGDQIVDEITFTVIDNNGTELKVSRPITVLVS